LNLHGDARNGALGLLASIDRQRLVTPVSRGLELYVCATAVAFSEQDPIFDVALELLDTALEASELTLRSGGLVAKESLVDRVRNRFVGDGAHRRLERKIVDRSPEKGLAGSERQWLFAFEHCDRLDHLEWLKTLVSNQK